MASQIPVTDFVVVIDDDDDVEDVAAASPPALRKAPRSASPRSPDSLDAFSTSPPLPKRRSPASPIILLDDDTPPPPKRRSSGAASDPPGSVVPETPQSFVPCSLGPAPRAAAVAETPISVPPCSFRFDFDAAVSEIPGSAVPCAIDPDIVVVETPGFGTTRSAGTRTSPVFSSASPQKFSDSTPQEEEKHKKGKNAQLIEERNRKQEEKRLKKEEKAKEKKRQQEEKKLLKEANKAQQAEKKKYDKEKEDWESGKHALKSIVAEIDSTIIESGSVGGSLLTKFAEKDLKYRVTANSIRGSILWKMQVPQIGQDPASVSEVPYILFVLQAEELCALISRGSFLDHVREVRSRYPTFTICYVTNKLMNYITKCERSHYRNPSSFNSWKRPPVEEVLCKLATDYVRVHSRQCADEAQLAEHVVGLTSSLANCKFRKPLTWLSVHANGAMIPKNFIDKDLAKKDTWMKALIAIPKVQPRFALAIWKTYPTMRSLLNVYMDPSKTVSPALLSGFEIVQNFDSGSFGALNLFLQQDHEKELCLKDLKCEDRLGDESRRVGPKCSRRVYRILMAQNGAADADDAE